MTHSPPLNLAAQISCLETVVKKLEKTSWFARDAWLATVHLFPHLFPEAATLNVFKAHWMNEAHDGIHFETSLPAGKLNGAKSYLALHIFHQNQIPGTKFERKLVSKPFVDQVYAEVSTWEAYIFRAGKYGMQPFTYKFIVDAAVLENLLLSELERLCCRLGPVMDEVLKSQLT